jgi:uncharacterized protein YjbI with pentapeptide repeats
MPPAREDRAAWLRLLKTDIPAFNDAINAVDGSYRPDLRGADLSGLDLRKAFLGRVDLTGASLRRAKVRAPSLTTCRLQDVDFAEAVIEADDDVSPMSLRLLQLLWKDIPAFNRERSQLSALNLADLSDANLAGADLNSLAFYQAVFAGADLSAANLRSTHIMTSDVRGARFAGNTLELTRFDGSDLSDADLTRATLRVTGLENVRLDRTRFDHATLEETTLITCVGEQTSFLECGLIDGAAGSCKFSAAIFRGATLTKFNFEYGGLVDCDLRDVRATRVTISDCDIGGSDFRGATGLKFDNVKNRERAQF